MTEEKLIKLAGIKPLTEQTLVIGHNHDEEETSCGCEDAGNDDVEMAIGELQAIIDNCSELLEHIHSINDLEAWNQSKITKAADYIRTVLDYLKSQK